MAYVPLASKADGDILTAAYLNQLADNAAFLEGIASAVNVPFVTETTVAGGNFTYKYKIRHMHRYLHYYIAQTASTSDNIDVYYDGGSIYNDGGDRTAPYAWSGHVDLDATPGGLVVGDFYEVYVDVTQKTGSGISTLWYLLESPNTSL